MQELPKNGNVIVSLRMFLHTGYFFFSFSFFLTEICVRCYTGNSVQDKIIRLEV